MRVPSTRSGSSDGRSSESSSSESTALMQLRRSRAIGGATAVVRARVMPTRSIGSIGLATAGLLVTAAIALTIGAAPIPAHTSIGVLLEQIPFVNLGVEAPGTWERIVVDVRLPRVVTAGLVGAALAYSGAAYQGVFRNPLADSFLLGIASGAALGAAIAIISPLPNDAYGFGWVPMFAFGGAAIAVVLVYTVSRMGPAISNTTLILAGVATSAMFGSVTAFILLTGGERAQPIFSFLFGSFNTASWTRLAVALPYLAVGAVVVAAHGRVLNVLQLDEEQASQLGVDVARTKLIVLGAASVLAATAVAIAGVIGFVGLIVPHVVRIVFGGDYRRLLPLSALLGAAFLIAADAVARTLIEPQEIPIGIVTAMVGGPFFLYLLRHRSLGVGA